MIFHNKPLNFPEGIPDPNPFRQTCAQTGGGLLAPRLKAYIDKRNWLLVHGGIADNIYI